MIIAGPSVPQASRSSTPVTLIDITATILAATGVDHADLPGADLREIIATPPAHRYALSEYHAIASRDGVFMLADAEHKYVHYVNEPDQLFNFIKDPTEVNNLATDPGSAAILQRFKTALRERLEPNAINNRARADQAACIEAAGGEAHLRAQGFFEDSPAPGHTATFHSF